MKRKDILAILIPSFIFVCAWIILSIHHNVASSTISEAVNMQITPISADFDTNIVTILKKRQNILPTYEINIPVENIVIPSTPSAKITNIPIPISSGSAKLATPEGNLSQ
jgi:hypothetical protein